MLRKLSILLAAIFLVGILTACGQAQPNPGTRYDPSGARQTQPKNNTNSELDGDGEIRSGVEYGRALETNYSGLGTVTYEVTAVKLMESWGDAGISTDMLNNARELKTGDKVMLVSLTVKNTDVPSDADLAQAALINCFHIVTQKRLDENMSAGTNGLPGPACPQGVEPSYFDNPFYENGVLSDKRYFQYELPAAGKSIEVVLGWVIDNKEIPVLENNEMYLQHTISSELLPITVD